MRRLDVLILVALVARRFAADLGGIHRGVFLHLCLRLLLLGVSCQVRMVYLPGGEPVLPAEADLLQAESAVLADGIRRGEPHCTYNLSCTCGFICMCTVVCVCVYVYGCVNVRLCMCTFVYVHSMLCHRSPSLPFFSLTLSARLSPPRAPWPEHPAFSSSPRTIL